MSATINRDTHVRRPARRGYRPNRTARITGTCLIVGVAILLLIPFTSFIIPPGHVGVLYRLFTTGTGNQLRVPGRHRHQVAMNRIYRYEVRTQIRDEGVQGLVSDGLAMTIEVSILFHPVTGAVGLLHRVEELSAASARSLCRQPATVTSSRLVAASASDGRFQAISAWNSRVPPGGPN